MNRVIVLILACQLSPTIAVYFSSAGQEQGIQIWRVGDVVVPSGSNDDSIRAMDLGVFNTQVAALHTPQSCAEAHHDNFDSRHVYIVVNTIADDIDGDFARMVHFWVGKDAPLAKRLSAVFHVANFWFRFGKEPQIYREGDTAESTLFRTYFRQGSVKPQDVPKDVILYQVKGEEVPLVIQVPARAERLQQDDCFVVESPHGVLVYKGIEANEREGNAADKISQRINLEYRGSSLKIIKNLDKSDPHFNQFLHLTGEDPNTFKYTASSTRENDAAFEARRNAEIQLYEVTDRNGPVTVTKVNENAKLKHEMLKKEECYLLNTASMFNVFAWIGNDATEKEILNVLQEAEKSISREEVSKKITVVRQGREPWHFLVNFYDFLHDDDDE